MPEELHLPSAKRAVDIRYGFGQGTLARNSIRDEEFVASHLRLRDSGVTHDEDLVAIYEEHAPATPAAN